VGVLEVGKLFTEGGECGLESAEVGIRLSLDECMRRILSLLHAAISLTTVKGKLDQQLRLIRGEEKRHRG
jgi:hypothetical protein